MKIAYTMAQGRGDTDLLLAGVAESIREANVITLALDVDGDKVSGLFLPGQHLPSRDHRFAVRPAPSSYRQRHRSLLPNISSTATLRRPASLRCRLLPAFHHDRQPKTIERLDQHKEMVQPHRLADVAVAIQIARPNNVLLRLGGCQNYDRDFAE